MNKNKKSIVLIGMPGCGKSTLAEKLAKRLKHGFIDMDAYIVMKYQKTVPEMFAISEEYFRERESICCEEILNQKPCIVSTGGGTVKNPKNVEVLRENGVVVYIDRPVTDIMEDVEIQMRPLLKDGPEVLFKLYEERHEIYKNAAHIHIVNTGPIEDVVDNLIAQVEAYEKDAYN